MKLNPYVNFDGRCAEAIKFYEQVIGAKVVSKMTWGEAPMASELPAETHNMIMHAALTIGDGQLMCADSPPGSYHKPTGMNVAIHVQDAAEGERLFKGLSQNGTVTMPYSQTFWSRGFGMCTDRFGVPWMVNCEQTPE
jgi:PhnB protein